MLLYSWPGQTPPSLATIHGGRGGGFHPETAYVNVKKDTCAVPIKASVTSTEAQVRKALLVPVGQIGSVGGFSTGGIPV